VFALVASVGFPNLTAIFASTPSKPRLGSQANIAASFAAPANNAAPGIAATSQSGSGIRTYDFTRMTQNEMQGVARGLGESGKIDLHQSLRLMLTPVIPMGDVGPNGAYRLPTAEQADAYYNQPLDYFQKLRDQLAFMEKSGQATDPIFGYEGLKKTLSILQEMQGKTSGVNITA
jgi:hypothetical protein